MGKERRPPTWRRIRAGSRSVGRCGSVVGGSTLTFRSTVLRCPTDVGGGSSGGVPVGRSRQRLPRGPRQRRELLAAMALRSFVAALKGHTPPPDEAPPPRHGTAVLLRLSLAGSSRFAPLRTSTSLRSARGSLTLFITGADVGHHRRRSRRAVLDDRRRRDSAIRQSSSTDGGSASAESRVPRPAAIPRARYHARHGPDDAPRRLPARLPRHLRVGADGGGRQGRGHPRPPRPPVHARRPLRQGQPLPRRRQRDRPADLPDGARRPEGRRPELVPPRHLGRGDRPRRRRPAGHARPGRPRGDPAVLLRRHHGARPGLDDGAAAVRPPRRLAAAHHHLHRGRDRRDALALRRAPSASSRRPSSRRA